MIGSPEFRRREDYPLMGLLVLCCVLAFVLLTAWTLHEFRMQFGVLSLRPLLAEAETMPRPRLLLVSTLDGADRTVEYRVSRLEEIVTKTIDKWEAEHRWISHLLIATLVGVITSLLTFMLTPVWRRRKPR